MVDPEVVEDLDARVALRNQLYQAGLTRIFDKMIPLQNDLLHRKMDEFQEVEENDAALIYGDMMLNETMDPPEILSNILRMITGTEAYDCLRSILQHIMLIQGDTQAGVECYRLLESIVSEIVLRYNDRHAEDYYTGTLTVDALIAKFAEENELKQALEDAAPRSNFLRVEGGNNEASGQENGTQQRKYPLLEITFVNHSGSIRADLSTPITRGILGKNSACCRPDKQHVKATTERSRARVSANCASYGCTE